MAIAFANSFGQDIENWSNRVVFLYLHRAKISMQNFLEPGPPCLIFIQPFFCWFFYLKVEFSLFILKVYHYFNVTFSFSVSIWKNVNNNVCSLWWSSEIVSRKTVLNIYFNQLRVFFLTLYFGIFPKNLTDSGLYFEGRS